jgi:hypothetical protein
MQKTISRILNDTNQCLAIENRKCRAFIKILYAIFKPFFFESEVQQTCRRIVGPVPELDVPMYWQEPTRGYPTPDRVFKCAQAGLVLDWLRLVRRHLNRLGLL